MRIGLISDVHANVIALEAVLDELARSGVDVIYNAGDLIGYYPYPNETIEMLRQRKVISIRGNHDRSVLDDDTFRMNPMASSAISWTAMELSESSRSYLRSLNDGTDFLVGNMRCSMHHGSPEDEDEYIFEDDADQRLLDLCWSKLLILGHTHVPFVKHLERGHIVNPGSVGQPRDGDPRSSYMIFDSTKSVFENRRVKYDIVSVQKAVLEAGLPRSLADRLSHGW